MKIAFICLLLILLSQHAFGQKNYLLDINQLNKRISNGKDTTFIINFWATWCGPCVAELPNFEKLHAAYPSNKVKIILMSVDYQSKLNTALIPFIKKHGLKNEVFLLNEKDQQEYINRIDSSWSGSIPATLFIKGNKRKFMEQSFTYPQLLSAYQSIQ